MVLVDVVRRDPLTSGKLVGSPLTGLAGGNAPTALPGIPVDIGDDQADELGSRKVPDDGVEDWELGADASGAVLAGSAQTPTLRAARGPQVHRLASSAGVPIAAEPVVRPTGPGAVSPSGEDVSDYVYGIPTYWWDGAPKGLATRRQLRALGLCPGGHEPVAQVLWMPRRKDAVAYLYSIAAAKPKRVPTAAQLVAVGKALAARRVCHTCGRDAGYCIPTSLRECIDCHYGAVRHEGAAA